MTGVYTAIAADFKGGKLLNYRCDSTLSEPAPVTPEWSHIRGRAGYLNPGDNTRPYPIQAIRPTCPTVIR
jgi:hypothetical protein